MCKMIFYNPKAIQMKMNRKYPNTKIIHKIKYINFYKKIQYSYDIRKFSLLRTLEYCQRKIANIRRILPISEVYILIYLPLYRYIVYLLIVVYSMVLLLTERKPKLQPTKINDSSLVNCSVIWNFSFSKSLSKIRGMNLIKLIKFD